MAWLAITVELESAQAEALSEALIEAGAHSVDLDVDPRPGTTRMRLTALAERDSDPRQLIAGAAASAGIPSPEFSAGRLDDEDWVRHTQAQFGPLEVGERLWIVPSWHTPLVGLAPELAARTRPGGRALLSGILLKQVEEISAAYANDFEIALLSAEEDWALIEGTRR